MKIAVNGFDMNYQVEGPDNAPWVTFANSLVTSLEMWDEQARALAGRYRVLRYDMRGHGGSDAPPAPYSMADLASDAVGLWEALGVERSHWVGLSLGGMVGIHLGARQPKRFRSLVAADCRADANEASLLEIWPRDGSKTISGSVTALSEDLRLGMDRLATRMGGPHCRRWRPARSIKRGPANRLREGYGGQEAGHYVLAPIPIPNPQSLIPESRVPSPTTVH